MVALEILGFVITAMVITCFMVRIAGYCYLEFANNYDMYPLHKTGFGIFTFYEKPVKPRHEKIKWLINKALQAIYIAIVLGLFFSLIIFMFRGG